MFCPGLILFSIFTHDFSDGIESIHIKPVNSAKLEGLTSTSEARDKIQNDLDKL